MLNRHERREEEAEKREEYIEEHLAEETERYLQNGDSEDFEEINFSCKTLNMRSELDQFLARKDTIQDVTWGNMSISGAFLRLLAKYQKEVRKDMVQMISEKLCDEYDERVKQSWEER